MNDLKLKLILDAVDKASGEIQDVKNELKGMDKSGGEVNKTLKTMGGLIGAAVLVKFGRDILDVAVKMDTLNASMVTAVGSQQAATNEMARLIDFASRTPYQIDEVVGAFIKLKNLGLDPSEAALTSYGNTAGAMGKSLDQMIEAVADAATGEFERLKEFGIEASQQGDSVRFTFRGVTTEVKKSANDIEAYLRGIGDVEFAGGMERQMKTIGGSMSNLSDNWDKFLFSLSNLAPINEAVQAISTLVAQLNELIAPTLRGRLADLDNQIMHIGNLMSEEEEIAMFSGASAQLDELEKQMDDLVQKRAKLQEELDSLLNGGGSGTPSGNSTPGSGGNTSLTDKTLKEYANLGRDITDSWEQMYRDRYEIQSRSLDVEIQMEKEAAEMNKVTWEASKDFWQLQHAEKFEVLSRSTEALIAMDDSWQTAMIDGLDDLADYYDDTFSDRISGSVFDAFSTMEDTLVEFVNTGKASFKDLVNSILDDMLRMTIQQNISSPLASALSAGLSGLFAGGTTYAMGSQPSAAFGPALHNGGKVVPRFHFGGLAADEIPAVLLKGETVLDREHTKKFDMIAAAMNGGSQPTGTTIQQTISVDARGSAVSAGDLEDAVARGAARGYQQVFTDVQRRGPIRRAIN